MKKRINFLKPIANYQGVIKRTSKATYNPNVKSHLRVHYIYSTKNTLGNVVLSEGESDWHVIDENAKKGLEANARRRKMAHTKQPY